MSFFLVGLYRWECGLIPTKIWSPSSCLVYCLNSVGCAVMLSVGQGSWSSWLFFPNVVPSCGFLKSCLLDTFQKDWKVILSQRLRNFFCKARNYNYFMQLTFKVQRADLTCDVIRKVAPFVLSKLWTLVTDWSMRWSRDMFLIKLWL